jgi:hypothetical protein
VRTDKRKSRRVISFFEGIALGKKRDGEDV